AVQIDPQQADIAGGPHPAPEQGECVDLAGAVAEWKVQESLSVEDGDARILTADPDASAVVLGQREQAIARRPARPSRLAGDTPGIRSGGEGSEFLAVEARQSAVGADPQP